MGMLFRHLLAVLALPFSVAVVVPWWIARRFHVGFNATATPIDVFSLLAGGGLLRVGGALFLACVFRFATQGEGTLAPWAVAFLVLNLLYIPLFEEPPLVRRFGDDYRRYKANVPRFLPRVRPWQGHDGGADSD